MYSKKSTHTGELYVKSHHMLAWCSIALLQLLLYVPMQEERPGDSVCHSGWADTRQHVRPGGHRRRRAQKPGG